MTSRLPPPVPPVGDLLDRSFGDGPAPGDVTLSLDAGRRALRRRRAVGAGSTIGAAAALVVAAALTVGSAPSPVQLAPADGQPVLRDEDRLTREEVVVESGESAQRRLRPSGPDDVGLFPGGRLAKARGVRVLDRVPNPLGRTAPDHSLGLAYERGGETTWALLTYEEAASGRSSASLLAEPAARSFPTLRLWLDEQVARQQDGTKKQRTEGGGPR